MNNHGLNHRIRLHVRKHIHRLAITTILLILVFSSLAVTAVDTRANTSPVSINMVYYGSYSAAIDEAIINANPEFLIGTSPVGPMRGNADINKFAAAGIKYFEYLTGGYEAQRPNDYDVDLQSNLDFISAVAAAGAYGIFFDEVSDGKWVTPDYNYLEQITSKAHSLGLKVVFNTGVNDWFDQLMDYCDYIGSTEQWANAPLTASQQKWASRTWLLRREDVNDAITAASLTINAWSKGVLAAYVTPSLITLPSWLPNYISLISSYASKSPAPTPNPVTSNTTPLVRLDTQTPMTANSPMWVTGDNSTSDTTPTFRGEAISSALTIVKVQSRIDGGTWTDSKFTPIPGQPNKGTWEYTPASLADGIHTLQVKAIDVAGDETPVEVYAEGGTGYFTFTIDTEPPVISNIAISEITSNSVVISWTTDEPATNHVDYGEGADYGLLTEEGTTLTTDHRVKITGLSGSFLFFSSSKYHFRVISMDDLGNMVESEDGTFTTSSPVFAYIVPVLSILLIVAIVGVIAFGVIRRLR